ncbi:hypothetical protein [Dorea sp. D27]|uniref:hypothetical protein n=1 Tax=Dorea sp. D27 TaxID=658665 RepID=UPI0006731906|nr:hypothetical protein [Dorea sp. D27]KMZ55165.1 hypothetical protein HMPREF0980_00844 [Dorea sp. D27]
MTMKTCRRTAAVLAGITMLCGGACKMFSHLPQMAVAALSLCAILCGIAAVTVAACFHKCPRCHTFIPVTLRPDVCIHCGENLIER